MSLITGFFSALNAWLVMVCETVFAPILVVFFGPINRLLGPIYQPYATIVAMCFFFGTMLWVGFYLKETYVNEGRPKQTWYTDLRIWTALSMLPHVFVYLYFY